MDYLASWRASDSKKCLLIYGARQVGKTYLVNEFSKGYEHYLYVNFETVERARAIFDGDLSSESVLARIGLEYPDLAVEPGKTLVFLDEIQCCPRAMVALKPLTMDGRIDVIASGSLMGVLQESVSSFPVGYVNILDLKSMDFEEFLWASGVGGDAIERVRECIREKKPIDGFVLGAMMDHFRAYLCVGGMPEAVKIYTETKDVRKVRMAQSEINRMYISDAAKYAPKAERGRIGMCFRSIPVQLSRDNRKFRYSDVARGSNSNARIFGDSLSWLGDAGLTRLCHNLSEPASPLASNASLKSFKLYFHDTGLLANMMGADVWAGLMGDDPSVNKGGIMENAVADALAKNGIPLYYYGKSDMELDFVLSIDGEIAAIAVKSGSNRQSRYLASAVSGKRVSRAIMLEDGNISVDGDGVEHYPLFAASFAECLSEKGSLD
jgi:predicted AAA+ superfamily ATPase